MKSKVVKSYLYEGLGFPIELENVELLNIDGEWLPKIDVQYIADEVIKRLAIQETRLTGNQVKFIRTYFSMPLREFSEKVIHTSHTAVSKWEKTGNETTKMSENTEQVLRLFILERTQTNSIKEQAAFFCSFQRSKIFLNTKNQQPKPVHIDMCA
ncbi:hypothetical protein [Legionella spiritensis]|uniref:Uncharacterized protein n=1 Tax=Legionella spiritensis TaxID=452 RepID=A0A0W0Z8G0_LEGSP|nr:hypothetical protein [Legionella spiritensis]KTD65384.1 hypothetical protein Lspi_0701 [Legionella spiritensis]SNV47136.1 Uncharacterised protein [Legionella spiritensis]